MKDKPLFSEIKQCFLQPLVFDFETFSDDSARERLLRILQKYEGALSANEAPVIVAVCIVISRWNSAPWGLETSCISIGSISWAERCSTVSFKALNSYSRSGHSVIMGRIKPRLRRLDCTPLGVINPKWGTTFVFRTP